MTVVEHEAPTIGRAPRMGVADALRAGKSQFLGGSKNGLSYRFDRPTNDADGALTFSLGGRERWRLGFEFEQELSMARRLLGGMGRSWLRLQAEESYPNGLLPEMPSELRAKLIKDGLNPRWATRTNDLFREGHELSVWLGSEFDASPLWAVREGARMLIECGGHHLRWYHADIMRTLASLGELLKALVHNDTASTQSVVAWERRDSYTAESATIMSLGVSQEKFDRLRAVVGVPARASDVLSGLDSVRAAARMLVHRLSEEEVIRVGRKIREMPRTATSALDELSKKANQFMAELAEKDPMIQGVGLANWFRDELACGKEKVNPERILRDWGIRLELIQVDPRIEAVSFWGPDHGPGILLNSGASSGGRTAAYDGISSGGRTRATLSHEICHLLIDRDGALPVAEVLGGEVPVRTEQRARAFQAEFLVPSEVAGRFYRNAADVDDAVMNITRAYGVTRTLAAWQVLHAFDDTAAILPDADRFELSKICKLR